MCEVFLVNGEPHPSNTRAACREVAEKYAHHDTWFGLEQEYTFFDGIKPLGWPDNGFPAPQGGYYCGVGADEVFGRPVVEAHLENCLKAGLRISGINAEVMPGQWEFQVGPVAAPEVADQLWIARWLLYRTAEDFPTTSGNCVSVTLDPKPVKGDWNGAGCHTNFSTEEMRENYDACIAAAEALGTRHDLHIANYGDGIEERLTGQHETASFKEFSYGVSHRGASVRIPWQVAHGQEGLHRGPSPERQHGPLRRDQADRRNGLRNRRRRSESLGDPTSWGQVSTIGSAGTTPPGSPGGVVFCAQFFRPWVVSDSRQP